MTTALAVRPGACDSRRFVAPDPGRDWDEATVVGVWRENESATTLRLELPEVAHFRPGQYYLVRLAMAQPPGAIEQPYSVSVTHTFTRSFDPRHASYDRRIDTRMIGEIVDRRGWDAGGVLFFVAGPADMVDATVTAISLTWPGAEVYSEDHT